jgi:formate dehydrogenase assembly factor FdhD
MALPRLSDEARPATTLVAALNERGEEVPTPIAGEHPLTVFLDKRELVTLMTLGGAPEHLTLGYLRNQRLVDHVTDIAACGHALLDQVVDDFKSVLRVTLANGGHDVGWDNVGA